MAVGRWIFPLHPLRDFVVASGVVDLRFRRRPRRWVRRACRETGRIERHILTTAEVQLVSTNACLWPRRIREHRSMRWLRWLEQKSGPMVRTDAADVRLRLQEGTSLERVGPGCGRGRWTWRCPTHRAPSRTVGPAHSGTYCPAADGCNLCFCQANGVLSCSVLRLLAGRPRTRLRTSRALRGFSPHSPSCTRRDRFVHRPEICCDLFWGATRAATCDRERQLRTRSRAATRTAIESGNANAIESGNANAIESGNANAAVESGNANAPTDRDMLAKCEAWTNRTGRGIEARVMPGRVRGATSLVGTARDAYST